MKSGKEIALISLNKNLKVKTGAIENYKAPVSIFLNITSWLLPINKITDCENLLKDYRNTIKQYLKNNDCILEKFKLNNIVDISISNTGIKSGKPTFFEIEINLYQKGNLLPLVKPKNENILDLKPILQNIVDDIVFLPMFVKNKDFNFLLRKNSCSEK